MECDEILRREFVGGQEISSEIVLVIDKLIAIPQFNEDNDEDGSVKYVFF